MFKIKDPETAIMQLGIEMSLGDFIKLEKQLIESQHNIKDPLYRLIGRISTMIQKATKEFEVVDHEDSDSNDNTD